MPLAHEYGRNTPPVASTSAMFLILRSSFLGSNDQKQSVGKRILKCSVLVVYQVLQLDK